MREPERPTSAEEFLAILEGIVVDANRDTLEWAEVYARVPNACGLHQSDRWQVLRGLNDLARLPLMASFEHPSAPEQPRDVDRVLDARSWLFDLLLEDRPTAVHLFQKVLFRQAEPMSMKKRVQPPIAFSSTSMTKTLIFRRPASC